MNDALRLPPALPLAMPHPDSVPGVLLASLDLIGPAMLRDPVALRQRLDERCPDGGQDVELLMTALHEQIPQTLLEMQPVDASSPLVARLQAQLRDRHVLNDDAAGWAVRTWLEVLTLWFLPANARPADATESAPAPPSRNTSVASDVFDTNDDAGAIVPNTVMADSTSPSFAAAPSTVATPADVNHLTPPRNVALPSTRRPTEPPDPRAGDRRRRRGLATIGASLAAAVIAGVLAYPAFAPGAGWLTARSSPQRAPAPTVVVAATPRKAVPVARQAPRITDVDVPTRLVAGEAATLSIRWAAEPGAIVSVERRLRSADGHPAAVDIMPASTLEQSGTDALTLPIDTARAATGIVEEFVLVDRNGLRSEPWRVDLAIAAPIAEAQSKNVAVARSPGLCADRICGRVVRSQPISAERITDIDAAQIASILGIASTTARRGELAGYDILVRMDDRTERAFRRSAPLAAGVRVRVDGRRLIVAGDHPAPSLH